MTVSDVQFAFERIQIANADFHIRKSLEQCPPGMMLRELVRNGEEAEARPEEDGTRRIEIRAKQMHGVDKLAIYNTGRGMTDAEVVRATDLASTIRKQQGLGGGENRGEGAKVASLPFNGEDMIFRSCHDGIVSEVTLRRVGDAYVRQKHEVDFDDGTSGYSSVLDVTALAIEEGYDTSIDWTEVTLVDNNTEQDTTRSPYGEDVGKGEKRSVLTELFDRFYAFEPHVEVYAEDAFHGRKSVMRLRPSADAFRRHETEQAEVGQRIRREHLKLDDGVVIEYVHLPMLSGNNNCIGAYELAGQPTRACIVWRNECYDLHLQRQKWSRTAAQYGLPYVHSVISVFVHLPDDYPVRATAYRIGLEHLYTRDPVVLEDFQAAIRDNQPHWLRDLVQRAMAPRHAVDMREVEEELQRRLRRARIRRVEPAETGGYQTWSSTELGAHQGGAGAAETYVIDPNADQPTASSEPHSRSGGAKRAKARAQAIKPPHIQYLDTPEQVEAESLTERAARYVEGTNTLFINALHGSVEGKTRELEAHFGPTHDLDLVRDDIADTVRVEMALAIGTVVVNALAKAGLRTWDDEHLKRALSDESLTVAAESNDLIVVTLRQRLAQRASFQSAKRA